MVKLLVAIIIQVSVLLAAIPSDTCNQNTWITNSFVHLIVPVGDKIYIGGSFTVVMPSTGCGVPIDSSTGQIVPIFPKINGTISAVCSDGNGGWFVGGTFTTQSSVVRKNLVHILSNGTMDPSWSPDPDSAVLSLAIRETTVYTGGKFANISGVSRNTLAALNATTGVILPWNPNSNGIVYALTVSGSTVYAGGYFTVISGQARKSIAALDATTGNVTDWNPNVPGNVYTIVKSGTSIYLGGQFSSIGGQGRNNIGAVDSATGNVTTWNPNPNSAGWVYAIAVNGTTVYAGGMFLNIGGQSRSRIAALDATTGNATSWNPNLTGPVYALIISGSTMYVGGSIKSVGGLSRNGLFAYDIASQEVSAWNPNANGTVYALALSGTSVYAGGNFTGIGGQFRNHIACIDATTGRATSWNPNATGAVNANCDVLSLAVNGTTVYAGGIFANIGGQSRNNVAALDATTGNALIWNPNADNAVRSLGFSGTNVYATGDFTNIGGQNRNHIAALDTGTGDATVWNPNSNGFVNCLAVSGSAIYAIGNFDTIGGQNRTYIASLDAVTGNALAWNPNPDRGVNAIAISGNTIYAGGGFTNIGGQSRNAIAALDAATGDALPWNPKSNGYITSLAVSGGIVYAGGEIDTVGGLYRNHIAAVDATTGSVLAWNPNANNSVSTLAIGGTALYAAGLFSSIGKGVGHPYFAEFDGGSPYPVVQSITPSSGLNNTSVQITNLSGLNFRPGATVKLVKTGYADIVASSVSVTSSTQITCAINIANAAPGAWDVVIANDDLNGGTLIHGFSITALPPVLLFPTNNTKDLSLTPTLSWHKAPYDSLYTIQLSASSNFSSLLVSNNHVTDTFLSVPSGLLSNNTTYFWKASITKRGKYATDFCSPWQFTTSVMALGVPSLLVPTDNAVSVSINPVMTWNHVNNSVSYHVQIAADSLFNTIIIQDSTLTDTSKSFGGAANDTKYFWRVRALNASGPGGWSVVRKFTTIVAIPSIVTLKSPLNSDTVKIDSVFLKWSSGSPKVDRYWVEYGSDSSFTTTTKDTAVVDTGRTLRNLRDNSKIWWRAKAHNVAGWGGWSTNFVFSIKFLSTHVLSADLPKHFDFDTYGQKDIIRYALPKAQHVLLRLYNIKGQLQEEFINKRQDAGFYSLHMHRGKTAAGSFLMIFKAGEFHREKIIFIMK